MKIRYILLLLAPALLLANGGGEGEGTDILPRAVNFVIFASILYYLLADHVKIAYKGRIAGIADRLDSIQVKVKESLNAKEAAQAKVEEAKANAKSLIETSKREAQLLSEKVASDVNSELLSLEKGFQEKIEIERRKMARAVVTSVLDEMFDEDSVSLDKEELVKIVMKKVA
ncbi:F0F1 ATP synthase subunit B [Sulfurospirillum arcachonense]|uniref:F0F1 ATP synthase subunit B n=1 Tax=Sulfurospirillum arcachonense TaxID=57666 RepID=UPI00046A2C7C|nr:F0F1 ATP synthase subunit B [Sulfurospirillum arcachonense]